MADIELLFWLGLGGVEVSFVERRPLLVEVRGDSAQLCGGSGGTSHEVSILSIKTKNPFLLKAEENGLDGGLGSNKTNIGTYEGRRQSPSLEEKYSFSVGERKKIVTSQANRSSPI